MPTPFCPLINRYCLGSSCARFVPEHTSNVSGKDAVVYVGRLSEGGVAPWDGVAVNDENSKPTGLGWCGDNLRTTPFKDPAVVVKGVES